MTTTTRPIRLDDVPILVELLLDNRDFLAPWEPNRDPDYLTAPGQEAIVRAAIERDEQGSTLAHVILDGDRVVGRITLSEIVRGPFQSCNLGYWVAAAHNGRGVGTAAVRDVIRIAFEKLGLHRIQAATLVGNIGSQRVLERNGFVRFGLAPKYLHIAGDWRDHVLYQLIAV